jgi:hypothetical protein
MEIKNLTVKGEKAKSGRDKGDLATKRSSMRFNME